jgi:M6 family metalloprotease-like protein
MKRLFRACALLILLFASKEARGAEWLSTPQSIGKVSDFTVNGAAISSRVAYWAKARADGMSQHIAGRTPAGALQVFSWGTSVNKAENLTARPGGAPIVGSPIAWLGSQEREHVTAISNSGAVLLFTRTPTVDWTAIDLSTGTGKKFSGNLVSWVTRTLPPTDNVAAMTEEGEVRIFRRKGDDPFSVVSAAETRLIPALGGLGGAWSIEGVSIVEHLVALGKDGKLYDLSKSSLRDWTPVEIPLQAGQTPTPDLDGWLSRRGENVAVRTQSNALLVITRTTPGAPWAASNLTEIDGEEVTGRPAAYQSANAGGTGTPQDSLAVRSKDGHALVFWKTERFPLWQLLNLTELTGAALAGSPGAWTDVVAVPGPDNHLRVVWDFSKARELTEGVGGAFQTLHVQNGTRKTVTILWNPETNATNCTVDPGTNCPKPCNPADLGQGVRLKFLKENAEAAVDRLKAYFRENSGGLLTVSNEKIFGWYESGKFGAHYGQEHGPGKCEDGWSGPGAGAMERRAEAIRRAAAEPGFDFSVYDINRDTTLSADELAVIIMIPVGTGDAGFSGPVRAENNAPLIVDGVTIPEVTEISVHSVDNGSPFSDGLPHLGHIARQLSHRLLGHVDMGWAAPAWPFANRPATALGALALMDNVLAQGHHDAFSKLKFGWLRPQIVWREGSYALKDVETRHSVRVLLHPVRGVNEFLLFENRFRGSTFDRGLPADGLAIYHLLQDPGVERNARPPFYVSPADWSRVGAGDWGRRAVRLIRSRANSGHVSDGGASIAYDDALSLWRRDTGYDLEPFLASRERPWLRWGSGENPWLALRNVSAPGPVMTFTLIKLPDQGPAICAARGKNCNWIDDGSGGRVYCGTCTGGNVCGATGIPNVCGCRFGPCEEIHP